MTTSPQEALVGYVAATNSHDFREVAARLGENAVFFFGDRSCRSRDEIRDYFERAWATVVDEDYSAHEVEWLSVTADAATAIYRYEWSGLIDGAPARGQGRATNVFTRSGDRWLLVHEHLSPLPR
jgi:ketosteroid isomerase-like protein